MGEVYLVRDLLKEGQHLALKSIRHDSASRAGIEPLRNEFLWLSATHHPNMTRVYEFSEDAVTKTAFFTSEFVNGVDLMQATARLDWRAREDIQAFTIILTQLLRALAFLHSRGMIYCDLKPENVLVRGDVQRQQDLLPGDAVKLIDFGLVRSEKQVTKTKIWGTPYYVAPETVLGAPIDRRADLYSLGIVLYQLATRRLPFGGSSNLEIVKGHIERTPLPPVQVNNTVPVALSSIILRLMDKNPDRRYQGALELLHDVGRAFGIDVTLESPQTLQSYLRVARLAARSKDAAHLETVLDAMCATGTRLEPGRQGDREAGAPQEGPIVADNVLEQQYLGQGILVKGESGSGRHLVIERLSRVAQANLVPFIQFDCASRNAGSHNRIVDLLARFRGAIPDSYWSDEDQLTGQSIEGLSEQWKNGSTESGVAEAQQILANITLQLVRASRIQPLVLHFNNLHEGDQSALAVFGHILEAMSEEKLNGIRLLLLATSVDFEDVDNQEYMRLASKPLFQNNVRELNLTSLDQTQVRRMLQVGFVDCQFSPEFMKRLLEETGGNLRSLTEILSVLLASKVLVRTPRGWTMSGGQWAHQLTPTARKEVEQKIRKLPEGARGLAVALSFFRGQGDAALAGRVAGLEPREVPGCLSLLVERKIVRERIEPNQPKRHSVYSTGIKESLYRLVAPLKRKAIHASIARCLEEQDLSARKKNVDELSYQFLMACEKEKGIRYGLEVAKEQTEKLLFVRAIETYEQVLEAMGEERNIDADRVREEIALLRFEVGDWRGVLRLLSPLCAKGEANDKNAVKRSTYVVRARALCRLGEFEPAAALLKEAGKGLSRTDLKSMAEVYLGCAELHSFRDDPIGSLWFCEEVIRIIEAVDDGRIQLWLYALLSDNLSLLGCWEEASEHLRTAMHLLQGKKIVREIATELYARGRYYRCCRRYEDAIRQLKLCLMVRTKASTFAGIGEALREIGEVYAVQGRNVEAKRHFEQALSIYKQSESRVEEAAVLCELGNLSRMLGQQEEAEEKLRASIDLGRSLGKRAVVARGMISLAEVMATRGEMDESGKVLSVVYETIGRVGEFRRIWVKALAVEWGIAFSRGLLMQALQQAQVARVAAQEVNEGELEGLFLRLEGTTLLELGLTGRVRQCVAGLMEVANRAGLAREEGWARLLNVVAVSMEGAGASGNDLVATAVEAIHGAENPRECAIVHWKWGQCCLRLGDEEQAYLELEEALYLARMLKWKFLIAECLVARGIFETQARSGSLDRAEECLQEALRLSAEGYYPGPYWKACYSLAGVWNGRRRSDERSNLGRQARRALKSMLAGLPAEIRRPYFEASGVLGGHGNLGGEAGTKELQEVSSSSSLRNSSSSASSWRSARDGEVEGG